MYGALRYIDKYEKSIITFFVIFVLSDFFGITFYVLNSENYEIIEITENFSAFSFITSALQRYGKRCYDANISAKIFVFRQICVV